MWQDTLLNPELQEAEMQAGYYEFETRQSEL